MAQNNATVQFYYVPVNGTLPSNRDENTIYFDAEEQKLHVGDALIASYNNDNYVSKTNPSFGGNISFYSNAAQTGDFIQLQPNSGTALLFAGNGSSSTPCLLKNVATPTGSGDNFQAANKGYVDSAISTAIANLPTPTGTAATWIVN